jgi:uncharacterized lipoprotein NlpE involved in copper resistance
MIKQTMLVVLFLVGCDNQSDCDQRVRDLYQGQDVIVWIVNRDVSVYRIKDQYVTCDSSRNQMDIQALKPVTWEEAYCSRMVDPKGCLEREKAKPAEKESP